MMWFVLDEEEVFGPFTQEDVTAKFHEDILVWGPGLEAWSKKKEWEDVLSTNPDVQKNVLLSIVPDTKTEDTEQDVQIATEAEAPVQKSDDEIKWFYACNKEKFGPFKENELIDMLKMLNFSSQVYLWHKGLDTWGKLEDFPEVMSKITQYAA